MMGFNIFKNTVLLFVLVLISCGNFSKKEDQRLKTEDGNEILKQVQDNKNIIVGANQTERYLPLLKGGKVGVVANQTSVIFKSKEEKAKGKSGFAHLVDSLTSLKVDVVKVFAPEHGFRGTADAGEHVAYGIDTKTGLPIISLYGNNRKPTAEQLKDIDFMVFDIQDVGVRFYTYIGTLHYVMEACAEANIPLLILDRPNPNGHYIDGPILEPEYKSFVGMHPIPIVHAMTIGEYAKMINGEKWLEKGIQCDITVIPNKNYSHNTAYSLPIKPSPNLPNDKAINLYPSLCFFEGTNVSVGRGTDKQFQVFGSPFMKDGAINYCFTPQPNLGAKHPKHQDKECCGFDLSDKKQRNEIHLGYLIEAYASTLNKESFFNDFFTKLAGNKTLQQQIENGLSESQIKETWQEGLDSFKKIRNKYLIYN